MTKEEIKQLIESGMPEAQVEVIGDDGQHFEAIIVSDAFEGKTLLQQHKLVYGTLGDAMKSAIHALSMKTLTPREWKAQQE